MMTNSLEIAGILVEHGANLDAVATGGQTALMINAANGHTSLVAFLLDKGADLTIRNKAGQTVLSLVQESEDTNPHVVALLRDWVSPS